MVPPSDGQEDDERNEKDAQPDAQSRANQQVGGYMGCVHGLELLGHIVPRMTGREIFEFAKDPVAVLFVKFRGLETEGVEKGVGCAAYVRLFLGQSQ